MNVIPKFNINSASSFLSNIDIITHGGLELTEVTPQEPGVMELIF